jgi:hypothetical protein
LGEEKKVPHRPSWRVQPGAKYLVQIDNGLDRFVLTYNLPAQYTFKIL